MKILLAIHGLQLDMAAIDFACYLANLSKSPLTGIFLEGLEYDNISTEVAENEEQRKSCDQNIARFKEGCTVRDTICKVHRDTGVPAEELLQESRLADILIIDSALSFPEYQQKSPSDFVRKILAEAECPVIIAPESNMTIEELVFTYDGSRSSVYAIKQFTYLFPGFRNSKVSVIEVHKTDPLVTQKPKLKEWLDEHYSNVEFSVLIGDEQNRLLESALIKENSLIVMGSFGRGAISNFFRDSHAASLIKVISGPLFITHC